MEGLTYMKKLGLFITSVLLSGVIFAEGEGPRPQVNLTIALAEPNIALNRPLLGRDTSEPLNNQADQLTEQARQLNEQIGNRVEQRLQERLELQLSEKIQ